MTFEIIPAIDLSAGRLGRLTARGPVSVAAFGGDPLAAATAFVAAGVPRLHVVDMDLALRGRADNLVVIASVVALGVPVQAAGGAASEAEVQALLDTGADRAVLGSAGLQDRDLVTGLAERLGSRLVIGVETDGDRIRGRGRRSVDLPLATTLDWLVETAARRFVVTGLQRVGSLAGPDLEGVRAVVSRGRDVVAAGGIATPEDVRALRRAGAEGAIVGRAALEVLDLAALLVEGAGP
jgi:phosphoribosylformimino-5-aminoimidazole carboxamide ribonucleotide (ProFAR) isomerase